MDSHPMFEHKLYLADTNLQDFMVKIRNPQVKATVGVWKMVLKENKLEKELKY